MVKERHLRLIFIHALGWETGTRMHLENISSYIDGNDYPVYVWDKRARLIVAKRKHTRFGNFVIG
jgi:hypothetical protein